CPCPEARGWGSTSPWSTSRGGMADRPAATPSGTAGPGWGCSASPSGPRSAAVSSPTGPTVPDGSRSAPGYRGTRESAAPCGGRTDMSSVIRVLLVDDAPLVRTGLRLILGGAPDIEVVGEAEDGQAGVDLVAQLAPDVVLMDIRMPRMDGLAATSELLASPASTRVIVLTTFDTDDMVVEALRIGAHGFLLKSTRPERLVEAVRGVMVGEPPLSPSVTQQLINRVAGQPTNGTDDERRSRALERLERLTDREREVAVAI